MIIHCRRKEEAEELLEAIKERLRGCRLKMNVEKTKIVYCKNEGREEAIPKGYHFE